MPKQTHNPLASAQARAAQAVQRAKRRGFWRHFYQTTNSLFHLHPGDLAALLRQVAKWALLGSIVGVLAGSASALFLTALNWATQVRLEHPWLLWWLPIAGLLMGWIYLRFGGTAAQGNNLVIDEVNRNRSRIPLRMAPMVLLGTITTHLFGGSAGREGTAIQMGASLADSLQRLLGLNSADRRMMLMAGISGGFGSVFGVPVAGAIFGMEVQSVGRIHYEGLVPCLVASYVGDLVTRAWGVAHASYPQIGNVPIQPWLLLMVVVAGSAFGLTSLLFVELIHGIKRAFVLLTTWTPLYPFVGGIVLIVLTLLVGTRDYLGLSLPLIVHSLDGSGVSPFAFLFKLLFTVVTIGSGYLGGEVTPLFVIGATLGYTLGTLLGVDPTFLAAIGMVALFAGASNTPLACAIMGVELFGGGATLYLFLGCVVAYLASGHRGIYGAQFVTIPKVLGLEVLQDESLQALAARRGQGWLPRVAHLDGSFVQRAVSSLMSSPVVTIAEETSLAQLLSDALAAGVRSIPVVDGQQRVVGIVTDRDLQRCGIPISLSLLRQMSPQELAAVEAMLGQWRVRDLMSRPVTSVVLTATLQEALLLFMQRQLKRLPVVDGRGQLVGMLTRSDLLREFVFAGLPNRRSPAASSATVLHVTVQDVIVQPAVTLNSTTPLTEAIESLRVGRQSRAVVVDGAGRVSGFLTTSDLLARVPALERPALLAALVGDGMPLSQPLSHSLSQPLSQKVGDVMTAPVITVQAETPAVEALRLLLEKGIKRLPVVDGQGHLLGLVGRAGLLQTLFVLPDD